MLLSLLSILFAGTFAPETVLLIGQPASAGLADSASRDPRFNNVKTDHVWWLDPENFKTAKNEIKGEFPCALPITVPQNYHAVILVCGVTNAILASVHDNTDWQRAKDEHKSRMADFRERALLLKNSRGNALIVAKDWFDQTCYYWEGEIDVNTRLMLDSFSSVEGAFSRDLEHPARKEYEVLCDRHRAAMELVERAANEKRLQRFRETLAAAWGLVAPGGLLVVPQDGQFDDLLTSADDQGQIFEGGVCTEIERGDDQPRFYGNPFLPAVSDFDGYGPRDACRWIEVTKSKGEAPAAAA